MNRSINRKIVCLLILIVLIGIGYSMLSTNINITGIAKINNASWDVHFENVIVGNKSVRNTEDPTINEEKNQVTFNVELEKPGDKYEFTVDVVNKGSIDAMVDIFNQTKLTEEQSKRIVYTVTYIDGIEINKKDLLVKENGKDTLLVTVIYADINESDVNPLNIDLSFEIDYVQATQEAIKRQKNNILEYSANNEGNPNIIIVPEHNETGGINEYVQISNDVPIKENYVFLGWSDERYADENSNWYNPGDEYDIPHGTVLYAQWYDLESLENKMNTYVKANDFEIYTYPDNFPTPLEANGFANRYNTGSSYNGVITENNKFIIQESPGYKILGVESFSSSDKYVFFHI